MPQELHFRYVSVSACFVVWGVGVKAVDAKCSQDYIGLHRQQWPDGSSPSSLILKSVNGGRVDAVK